MSEYIEREPLLEKAQKLQGEVFSAPMIVELIKNAPAVAIVDEPSQVCCRDCKHLMFSDMYGECRKGHKGIVQPWDSCAYGELRKPKPNNSITDDNRMLIYIPAEGNYIEIMGHRLDGFSGFEEFCEHLNKLAKYEALGYSPEQLEKLLNFLKEMMNDDV